MWPSSFVGGQSLRRALQVKAGVVQSVEVGMHEISVAIVHKDDLERAALAIGGNPLSPRTPWCFLPLKGLRVPDLTESDAPNRLRAAATDTHQRLQSAGLQHQAALAFTQYWGGIGQQAALVVGAGPVSEPIVSPTAINTVLAAIGVESGPHEDAFSAIGLDQVRSIA